MSNEPTVPGGANDIHAWARRIRTRGRGMLIVVAVIVFVAAVIASACYAALVEHIGVF